MRVTFVRSTVVGLLKHRQTWICGQCRSLGQRRWEHSIAKTIQTTDAAKGKPYYVTSPIFYVNAGM